MIRGNTLDLIEMVGTRARECLDLGVPREDALRAAAEAAQRVLGDVAPGAEQANAMICSLGPSMGLAWLESAFATVEVSARLAASLACTSLPKESVADVTLPWRTFAVEIPPGVLGDRPAAILVTHTSNGTGPLWSVTDFDGFGTFGEEDSLADYVGLYFKLKAPIAGTSDAWRASELMHRIFVGVCLELATRPHPSPPPGWSVPRRRTRGLPTSWKFRLSRPVKVDCREATRSYVSLGEKSVAVQTLVRGHHKRQPCGPGGRGRKWIHVEPYWRGPEDAPIAMRSHQL